MPFKCELPVPGESYTLSSSAQVVSTIAVLFHKGAYAKPFLNDARSTGDRSFAFLGSGFAQILWQIVSIREKTLAKTDLFASRHIKRGKVSLPVDIRPSKPPSLKLPIICFNPSPTLK